MADSVSDPWLSIIGLGEDGLEGLSPASRSALDAAEIVFGGPRHLELAGKDAFGRPWPVPFSIDPVLAERGKRVVVLASGDPFWFGAGTLLAEALEPEDWRAFPAPSTAALAAARLGWRQEELMTLGLHAAPLDRLRPLMSEGIRVLCLLRDADAVRDLADWVVDEGFGASRMWVLEALGGPRERVRSTTPVTCAFDNVRAPVAAALEFKGQGQPRASGLEDASFQHDGQITKRPVRALTLSALAPRPGERLWDLGAGSGSISVEWCLASGGEAVAVESREDRANTIRANAAHFGLTPRLSVHHGDITEALEELPDPSAVFIGGGATAEMLAALWDRLSPGVRIVLNAVTLETQALVLDWQDRHGGHLIKIDLADAAPLGQGRGWSPARTLVQWRVTRGKVSEP